MAEDFQSRFDIIQKLGKGGFANVFKVVSHADKKTYALKVLELPPDFPKDYDIMKEAYIMMALIHPNILKYYKVFQSTPSYGNPVRTGILVELCPMGDLEMFIRDRNSKRFSCERMKRWMLELASAVAYLHEKSIMHRDLKPQNIFVGKSGSLKIGDFGVSRMLTSTYAHTVIGTVAFMAPEALYGEYGFKADIFSLGCVYVCMATLQKIARSPTAKILELPPTTVYGETINSIIECCSSMHEEERPTAEDILRILRAEVEEIRREAASDEEAPKEVVLACSEDSIPEDCLVRERDPPGRKSTFLFFHNIRGQNIALSQSYATATRNPETEIHGVVFSNLSIEPGTKITIEIKEMNAGSHVLVSFGFTSIDPETLRGRVPESVYSLEEIGESWIVNRYERLDVGSRVSFHYDVKGNILSTCKGSQKYRRENQVVKTGMPVWATFNVSFQIIAVSIIDEARSGSMKLESVIGFPGKSLSGIRDNIYTQVSQTEPISPVSSGPTTEDSLEEPNEDVFVEANTHQKVEEVESETKVAIQAPIEAIKYEIRPKKVGFVKRPDSSSSEDSQDEWEDETTVADVTKPKDADLNAETDNQPSATEQLPPPPIEELLPPPPIELLLEEPTEELKSEDDIENDMESTGDELSDELLSIVENEKRNEQLRETVFKGVVEPPEPQSESKVSLGRLNFTEKIFIGDTHKESKNPSDEIPNFPPPPPLSEDEKPQPPEVVPKPVKAAKPLLLGPVVRVTAEGEEGDFERQPSFRSLRARFEELSKKNQNVGKRKGK